MKAMSGAAMPERLRGRVGPWAGGLVGALLLADAVILMVGFGQFNLGVLLTGVIGAGLLAMSLSRARVQAWLAVTARRRRIWRLGWRALGVWLLSVAMFWAALARGGPPADMAPAPEAIVVLGSRAPHGQPSATLEEIYTAPMMYSFVVEGFQIGASWGTPVACGHYQGRYPFSGEIDRIVVEVAPQPTTEGATP